MILSLVFFCLASLANAIMDTITHHFDASIFLTIVDHLSKRTSQSRYEKYKRLMNWFNPSEGWLNKYIDRNPANGKRKWFQGLMNAQFTDFWHTLKSIMITCLCLSVAFAINWAFDSDLIWCGWPVILAIVIVYGTCWNIVFNIFYNKLLIRKK